MLPFEDRFSRQRRLPEVGPRGQERLASAELRIARHADVELELDYLARAGVTNASLDPAGAPLPFPWTDWFEHDAALAVARGAWCALSRIRRELGVGRR